MKKKILLTGGNGFIGKNIKESFLAEKYEIFAPSSSELNLLNTENTDNYFKDKNFDAVIHSAVKPGHRNAKDPTNLFFSNMMMFENLERQKGRFKKFINLGSGAIYDVSQDIRNVSESEIFGKVPNDEHGFCKYVQCKLIEQLDDFVDLNIFGIFGKYEDFAIRFISNNICKCLKGLPMTIKQNRRFSYLFVDDLMPILEFFIENKNRYSAYNIVPDEKVELLQVAEIIRRVSGEDCDIKTSNDGYGLEYTGDNSRLKNEFKDLEFTHINDSVCKLYEYYESKIKELDVKLLLKDK